MKRILLTFIMAILIFGTIFAENSMNYILVCQNYSIKNGKTEQYISKTYRQGINKKRTEIEVEAQVNSQTLIVSEGKITSNDISKTSKKLLKIFITRYDKKVTWELNLINKTYREQTISQDEIQNNGKFFVQTNEDKLTKVGEDKILGYLCNVYTLSSEKYWISKDYNLILKIEQDDGNNNKSGFEAIELGFERPDDSLFEIAQDFSKFE